MTLEEIEKLWEVRISIVKKFPHQSITADHSTTEEWRDEILSVNWLIQRVKELEGERFYWNCPIHGQSQNAWGCPECVREMRERIKELENGLGSAIGELEYSGYYFDHPSLVKLRKLIEKEK
jgi:hypothetical protein